VGPNEVGKTSFLRALEHLNDASRLTQGEFTRGGDGRIEIRATFALTSEEQEALSEFGGIGSPRLFKVWNRGGGALLADVEPRLARDRGPRKKAIKSLNRLLRTRWFARLDAEVPLASVLAELHDTLPDEGETVGESTLALMGEAAEALRGRQDASVAAKQVGGTLAAVRQHELKEHPNDAAREYLFGRRPLFLWFDEDRRQIASSHSLDEEPSPALENLLALIDFDLDELTAAVDRNDRARVAELTNEARASFAELLRGRWGQAHVRVELDVEGRQIHVFATNTGGRLIPIADRSEGLRHFIALLAFVEREAADRDAVVLVDEAEQHLHYDAQADLVRVFSGQTAAKKVIYTTHSAGCLPHDLGTGVRVLEPTGPADIPAEEWDRSRVQNWFWTEGPGFSPLLLAMGASSFAFAGTRKAVVAEGISDVLLLPTLFREATERPALDFQIAPGLANVNEKSLAELDFVASRVAYLVDGDEAGLVRRQQLLDAGVSPNRIFVLGQRSKLTLEDVLRRSVYLDAVNKELMLRHGIVVPASEVTDVGRKKAVERWCESSVDVQGVPVSYPSERAVAHHVFEMQRDALLRGEELRIVEPKRQPMLIKLHEAILTFLSEPAYRAND
jgi:hypothetical protein